MELLYLWIHRSNCIHCQEFNISPEYRIKVDDINGPKRIIIEENNKNNFNIYKKEPILNATAVVGSNGSGKSTLLSFIATNICSNKSDDGEEYKRLRNDSYQKEKSIYVFKDDSEEIVIYHNLENDLDSDKYKTIHNTKDNHSSLEDLRKQTIVYLSNSLYVNEHLEDYSHKYPVINYNIHPSSIYIIAKNFFEKLLNIDWTGDTSLNDKIFSWRINQRENKNDFQNILDMYYYAYLLKNAYIENLDKIGPFSIRIESSINIIGNNVSTAQNQINHLKDKGKEFEKLFSDFTRKNKDNNLYTLYHNLLFEMYIDDDTLHKNLSFDKLGIDDCFDIIFSEHSNLKRYKKYYKEIKKFISIAEKFPFYENLFDNKSDMAYKPDRVVSYNENKKAFKEFISFIHKKFNACDSYVLRYLKIRDNYMSSGERALTNFFSWLVAIPNFDKIMGNTAVNNDNYLLLIDEIDLYSHPEWQRQIIKVLIDRISIILKNKKVQIIVTTHSPLLLSDFSKSNTIYLRKNDDGKSIVCDPESRKETFGANIYTILKDAFFLEDGAVGEYARCKLLELSKRLDDGNISDNDELFISKVGSEIIKNELRKKYIRAKEVGATSKLHLSKKDNAELMKLRKQLKDSLIVINKMIVSVK